MGYIPKHALENLHKYSYKGVDKSLVSNYVLNPFWNWFVTLWPLNVAPNTITLSGLCLVLCNFLTLIYFDAGYLVDKDGGEGLPPQWVYYTWGLGLFWYQTFDAIDGKQARRTGMAGPLGEMFDHGCDALNTTMSAILIQRTLNIGRSWWTVITVISSLANFYLTTWEEYHTGQLFLSYFSGPVEGILMVCFAHIWTGYIGASFWDSPILSLSGIDKLVPEVTKYVPNVPLNLFLMYFAVVGLGGNVVGSIMNVVQARRASKQPLSGPVVYLLPFVVTVALQVAWLAHGPSGLFYSSAIVHSHLLIPFMCAFGLQFAHQVGRMILAHVTKGAFPIWDWMWVWTAVAAVDANAEVLVGRSPLIQNTPERIEIAVYTTLLVSFIYYFVFCTLVIQDITEYMGIACFTVKKKDDHGDWKRAAEVNAKKSQ